MKKLLIKPAFTMIELVMVIVVLGIIAAVAIPRMERDRTQEAADMILSNIRYAQHMAINDFRENPMDSKWQRSFWQVKIENCAGGSGMFLQVGSDKDNGGDIDRNESAIDPANGKPMFWLNTSDCSNGGDETVSENIFIYKRFGVKSIDGKDGCKGVQHIGFDHLGRPHISFSGSTTPDYSSYMKKSCTFTFKVEGDDDFSITIAPETGYASIVGQNDS
jgi:prepilin-type N-terminal cleavage/methylation domain-containing protein